MSITSDETAELALRFEIIEASVGVGPHLFRLLRPRSADDLIDEEEFARDERIPYWAEIWPSARVLARWLMAHPGQGRTCLELGCGAGLCALAALAAGYETLATDYYADALKFTALNARRNGLPPPRTRLLDWRQFPDDVGRFDLVVGADVLYEPAYSGLVAAAIARSLAPGGIAIVTDPQRRHAEPFAAACRQAGLHVTGRSTEQVAERDRTVAVDMYEIAHLP